MKKAEPPPTPAGAREGPAVDASAHHQLITLIVSRQPEAVGDMATDLWERLFASLVSIIGNDGFDALYDRSLHLAGATFPWLLPAHLDPKKHERFSHLKFGLQGRDLQEAGLAMVLLLSTFTSVLSTLIGQELTRNILRSAWGDAFEKALQELSLWPTK